MRAPPSLMGRSLRKRKRAVSMQAGGKDEYHSNLSRALEQTRNYAVGTAILHPDDIMSHLLARKKSTSSLRRKRSEPRSY